MNELKKSNEPNALVPLSTMLICAEQINLSDLNDNKSGNGYK